MKKNEFIILMLIICPLVYLFINQLNYHINFIKKRMPYDC